MSASAHWLTVVRWLSANHPVALGKALANRLGGLIGNSIFAGILGAIGWTVGGVLPER